MSKYDYETMTRFYNNIIIYIMERINEENPSHVNNTTGEQKVSQPYLEAYEIFEPISYLLSDNIFMKDYYDEPHFEHYAIENLNEARDAIVKYISISDIDFSNDSVVQNYVYYDDILDEVRLSRQEELEEDVVNWINYFREKRNCDFEAYNLNHSMIHIKQDIESVESFLDNTEYVTNVEDIKSIIKEINTLFNKIIIDTKDI